jgi:hypothetical protein
MWKHKQNEKNKFTTKNKIKIIKKLVIIINKNNFKNNFLAVINLRGVSTNKTIIN